MKKQLKITYTLTKKDRIYFDLTLRNRNLTKTEFAKRVGISCSMLGYILNGKRPLTEEMELKFRQKGIFFTEE